MLRIFTICSLVLFTTLAKASDTITIALKTFVKVAVEDGQGGIFILGRNNSVSKYNEEGKKVATYTSNDAVECTQMFMYQGMQLALFYRDLQRTGDESASQRIRTLRFKSRQSSRHNSHHRCRYALFVGLGQSKQQTIENRPARECPIFESVRTKLQNRKYHKSRQVFIATERR